MQNNLMMDICVGWVGLNYEMKWSFLLADETWLNRKTFIPKFLFFYGGWGNKCVIPKVVWSTLFGRIVMSWSWFAISISNSEKKWDKKLIWPDNSVYYKILKVIHVLVFPHENLLHLKKDQHCSKPEEAGHMAFLFKVVPEFVEINV